MSAKQALYHLSYTSSPDVSGRWGKKMYLCSFEKQPSSIVKQRGGISLEGNKSSEVP
jgi:hypothetical protein